MSALMLTVEAKEVKKLQKVHNLKIEEQEKM